MFRDTMMLLRLPGVTLVHETVPLRAIELNGEPQSRVK